MDSGSIEHNQGVEHEVIGMVTKLDSVFNKLGEFSEGGVSENGGYHVAKARNGKELPTIQLMGSPEVWASKGSVNSTELTALTQLGMSSVDYVVTVHPSLKTRRENDTLVDKKGTMYGTFYLNGSGQILKVVQVHPDSVQPSDTVIRGTDEIRKRWVKIVDPIAFDQNHKSGVLEGLGMSIGSLAAEAPRMKPGDPFSEYAVSDSDLLLE